MGALLASPLCMSVMAENIVLTTPHDFQVLALSPNGKWACGVNTFTSLTPVAFRWNLETDEIEMIGNSNEATAWGIADDGSVSGTFVSNSILPQGRPLLVPGIIRNGFDWEQMELPEGFSNQEGYGYAITPDGRSMCGSLPVNGVLTPYIWRDGKIYKSFGTGKHAMPYAISPDGETVAGWAYGEKNNRVATYWNPDGTPVYLLDAGKWAESMFNTVQKFSPNGKKVLYWGGWAPIEEMTENWLYCLYDIDTDARTRIQAPSIDSTMEFYDLNDDGLLVGSDKERGYVYLDGEGMYIDDYLKKIGVDLTGYDNFYGDGNYASVLPIFRVTNVSNDGKTFIMLYYDKGGNMRSMCLKVDQNASNLPPAGLKVAQLEGINTVALTWKAPLGLKGIRGYNIYRDDKRLNGFLPLARLYYYDAGLEAGTYTYRVGTVNAAGTEELSEPFEVTVGSAALPAPTSAFARQKGVNSAYLSWAAPESTLIHKRYHNPLSNNITTMSVYMPLTMEVAVKFDKAEMANYTDAKIKEVTFTPMGEQQSWKVVIYTRDADGTLKEVASKVVTQELNYKQPNTVVFDEPVALPDGDLIVGLQVEVMDGHEAVIAAIDGPTIPGSADLMRQATDDDFFSAYESSTESGQTSSFIWALDVALELPDAVANSVENYNIYVDDAPAGTATTPEFLVSDLADGTHTFAIEANYADGSKSARLEKSLDIEARYAGVGMPVVDVALDGEKSVINATWDEPVNNDTYRLTYADSEAPTRGVAAPENTMLCGADYPADMLRGYQGYKVDNIRFYPLCDAIYTVGLYEDGVCIHEQEVDEALVDDWNVVKLDKEILIKEGSDYRVVVDAFDAEPKAEIFGVDGIPALKSRSDLYSIDGGLTWNSLAIETGLSRSWLLSWDLVENVANPLPAEGYDVVIDDQVHNSQRVTEPKYVFEIDAADNSRHYIRINTYYPLLAEAVEGETAMFRLAPSGINDASIASITLRQGRNELVADGEGVESMELYSASGMAVANVKGGRIALDDLADGIYVVKVNAGAASFTRKISIRR